MTGSEHSSTPHRTVLTRALTTALRGWDGRDEHAFITDTVLPIIAASTYPGSAAQTRSLLSDHSHWAGYAHGLTFALAEAVDVKGHVAAELDYAQHRLATIGRDLEQTGERVPVEDVYALGYEAGSADSSKRTDGTAEPQP